MRTKVDSLIMKVSGVGAILALACLAVSGCNPPAAAFEFTTPAEDTDRFMAWYHSITLTDEQEAVMKGALEPMPAPCCSDNSAYTCCCPCNLAKSWWGLSKHLIADEGAGVDEVRAAVNEWFERAGPDRPDGFSGDICPTAGCARAFKDNGCGGMAESALRVE